MANEMKSAAIVQNAQNPAAGKVAGGENGASASESRKDGEYKNADGTVTIIRRFRLDPKAVKTLGKAVPKTANNAVQAAAQGGTPVAAPQGAQGGVAPTAKGTMPSAPGASLKSSGAASAASPKPNALDEALSAVMAAVSASLAHAHGGTACGSSACGGSSYAEDAEGYACDTKGHDTPLENCKAVDPMFCPYHGIKAMTSRFAELLKKHGCASAKFDVSKDPSGFFTLKVGCPDNLAEKVKAKAAIEEFLGQQGFASVNDSGKKTDEEDIGGAISFTSAFKMDTDGMEVDPLDVLEEQLDALADYAASDDMDAAFAQDVMALHDEVMHLQELKEKWDGYEQTGSVSGTFYENAMDDVENAKQKYAQLKAKGDYNGKSDHELGNVALLCENKVASANQEKAGAQSSLQKAKKDAWGKSTNPPGFPGNDAVNDAASALHLNSEAYKAAKAAYDEAKQKGDKAAELVALHDMEKCADKAHPLLFAYKAKVSAMLNCLADAKAKGLNGVKPQGKTKEEKKAWFEAQGIKFPKTLDVSPFESASGSAGESEAGSPQGKAAAKKKAAKAAKDAVDGAAQNAVVNAASAALSAQYGEEEGMPGTSYYNPFAAAKMKPLAHDESLFPPDDLSEADILHALANGKGAGGGGGLGTKFVTIGGKKYVCKSGSGKERLAIENGYACDMAYRAAGVCAPDAKLYHFGNKVYKLAQFVEGKRLDDIMANGSEAEKQAVRDELLKGYALDALFSNWDVLGTNPSSGLKFSNIIVDKDGRAWRIDNDGAFAATGLVGGKKKPNLGKSDTPLVWDVEQWGDWGSRQWCDDFITMRADAMNKGVFDKYSTHAIFDAARHIDFDAAVKGLPKGVQAALAKPMAEMKQLTARCCDNLNGTICEKASSYMLEASYQMSKDGAREHCQSPDCKGYGYTKSSSAGSYVKKPFGKAEPVHPTPPDNAHNYAADILSAAKTINHHNGGDANKKSGVTDHTPNPDKIAAYEKAKPIIEQLAKDGNADAKVMMAFIGDIEASKKSGYTKGIATVPMMTLLDPSTDKAKQAAYSAAMSQYKVDHDAWEKEKNAHDVQEIKNEDAWNKSHGKPKFSSLTDQMSKMCAKAGVNYGWIPSAQKSQGSSSWDYDAINSKIVEMIIRGNDPKNPNFKGVWFDADLADGKKAKMKSYFNDYANNPSKLHNDLMAMCVHKAGMQLMLENSTASSSKDAIDKANHTVFVVRSETNGDGFMKKYGHEKNKVCKKFEAGTCESHAVNSITFGGARYGAHLPFSLVCGSFWTEGTPGASNAPFWGNSEHEFTCDKTNIPHIPIVCFGKEGMYETHTYTGLLKAYLPIAAKWKADQKSQHLAKKSA